MSPSQTSNHSLLISHYDPPLEHYPQADSPRKREQRFKAGDMTFTTFEGLLVKLEGDIDQGVEYYKKALYYNWHYADAMYNLGVAYGEMLKLDMAIVFYELAFHFNPHCAEACNNLGVIYKDCDNLDKVVECYQLALSIKPNFSQSLNNLGVVYTVQGKMDVVASMIEKAIVANPTYAEAYNNLVIINLQNLHCRTKGCEDPIQR
ncbi:hypothetical protein ACSBR1_019225 [Camellia fascicularis]